MPSNKKRSLKQDEFIRAAVQTMISHGDEMRSLQGLIDRMAKDYENHKTLRLPCRDTMYKYLSLCVTAFEQENDVAGLNPYHIFRRYSLANHALFLLQDMTAFSYRTVAENQNGFYIGLLLVEAGKEQDVSALLQSHFAEFLLCHFVGVGGLSLIFRSPNKEAEFYNLLTPHNTLA